jgi:hypothetical protein
VRKEVLSVELAPVVFLKNEVSVTVRSGSAPVLCSNQIKERIIMKEEIVYSEGPMRRPAPVFLRRVSWGAILAGLVVTLVLEIVLSVLGVAIGASTIQPLEQADPTKGYGIGSALWLGITTLLAIFSGACVAGRLSGGPREADGMLHGVATWATATLLGVFLLTTAVGTLIGGAAGLLGRSLSAGVKTTSSESGGGGMNLDSLKQQAMKLMPQSGGTLSPTGRGDETQSGTNLMAQAQQNPELVGILTRMFSRGGAAADPQDRDAAINLLSTQGNMTRDEAASTVDRLDRQYQQTKTETKQKVRETGATAAKGVATAAWWSFIFLILGAVAAAYGGFLGTRGLSHIRVETPAAG